MKTNKTLELDKCNQNTELMKSVNSLDKTEFQNLLLLYSY